MPSNLLIVESPSKAKTLKKYLGNDFEILASYGHVRDLIPKKGAVDTEHDFAMKYELIDRNTRHVDAIAKAVKAADHIFLATDPDREGEAIAWHIAEILKSKKLLKGKTLKRVVFHEITQTAVKAAISEPRDIAMPLVNAQQARRALDYLVGFNLSPLLWKKISKGLSAGRVQSPALRLIVEREGEIEAFTSQEYWSVHLDSHKSKQKFSAKLFQFRGEKLGQFGINNAEKNQDVINFLSEHGKNTGTVVKVDKKRKQRVAAAPFTTSTLQQEAVRKLGFTTDRAMRVAQQLYEGIDIGGGAIGLITYMRTDSVSLANEAIEDIRQYITKHFEPDYLPKQPVFFKNKSKNAQEAHEAIRPTSISRSPQLVREFLTVDQAKLYEMIWKRALACQMSPAKYDTVSLDISVGGPDNLFRATGQTLVFPGFIAVYLESEDEAPDDTEDENKLPVLEEGEQISLDKLYGEQHFTQPPPRYTEASLVKTLEEFGIGRPSTYASIISTLQAREYAVLDKKRFLPTEIGRIVTNFLIKHFDRYVDYDFTAKLEDQLDDVSNGKREWIPVLDEFWKAFHGLVTEKQDIERGEAIDEACPKCSKPLFKYPSKRGVFIGCSGYPECDYTRPVDNGKQPEEPVTLGTDPKSGSDILLLKGPYGFYVQLGTVVVGAEKKPRRAAWPKNVPVESADLTTALKLLSLPREVGTHPETGKLIEASIGRFGPYLKHNSEFKSIPKTDNVYDIGLERAVALLAEPKSNRGMLRQVGLHPDDQKPVGVYEGRYGPYVKHGKDNATIQAPHTPDSITLEQALAFLAAKIAKDGGGKKAKAPAKAKTAAKTAVKSPSKPKAAVKTTAKPKAVAKPKTSVKAKVKP